MSNATSADGGRRTTFKHVGEELRGAICTYLDVVGLHAFYTVFCRTDRDKEQLGQCVSSVHTGVVVADSTADTLREAVYLLDPTGRSDGFAPWLLHRTVPLRTLALFFPEGTNEAAIDRILRRLWANLVAGCYEDLATLAVRCVHTTHPDGSAHSVVHPPSLVRFGATDVDPNSAYAAMIERTHAAVGTAARR
jgi:hypothetical protein